jgi:hypothetical protein
MPGFALKCVAAFAFAALAVPSAAAADRNFFLKLGGITGDGAKADKTGQWVPVTSWFWGEFEVQDGAPKVEAKLHKEGFFDKGNVRISGAFAGCEVGKSATEAVLKTPGMKYTFQDVVITKCKPTSLTFNYGRIKSQGAW